jgi:rhamnogalacturonyl hydrolase YesR
MKDNVKHEVLGAIERLDSWIEKNSWSGWDPFDIRDTYILKKIDRLPSNLPFRVLKKIIFSLVDVNPLYARKLLRIRPEINAKGMGLFLSSYCDLFLAIGNKGYLEKALKCAEWLKQNRSQNYHGWSWGYPFDWQSPILIPKGTPSSIASVTIGDGFYNLYKCTGDNQYLTICEKICGFFLNDLKITYDKNDAICYSYTPLDDYQVHNTNLFVGEFLTRIGKETGDNSLIKKGICCGNFALSEQQPEGYLPYWGLSQTERYSYGKIHTDHFHSGFEIRALYGIWKNTGDIKFQQAYKKYLAWYINNLFEDHIIPKFTPKSKYPIDIHSCSEAILCRTMLLADHPEHKQSIEKTVDWVIKNMEYKKGEYTYLINKVPLIGRWRIDVPMIRWGQAWMFRALSEFYSKMY